MNDLINLPYPNPEIEKDFPAEVNRAAQFAPFAALTGYDAAVEESARLTDSKIELDDYEKEELNRKILFVRENPQLEYEITYFIPDEKKNGGEYYTKKCRVEKVLEFEGEIITVDGTKIKICDIIDIGGAVFSLDID